MWNSGTGADPDWDSTHSGHFTKESLQLLQPVMREVRLHSGHTLRLESVGGTHSLVYLLIEGRLRINRIAKNRRCFLYECSGGDLIDLIEGKSGPQPEVPTEAAAVLDSVIGIVELNRIEALASHHGDFAVQLMHRIGRLQRMGRQGYLEQLLGGKDV